MTTTNILNFLIGYILSFSIISYFLIQMEMIRSTIKCFCIGFENARGYNAKKGILYYGTLLFLNIGHLIVGLLLIPRYAFYLQFNPKKLWGETFGMEREQKRITRFTEIWKDLDEIRSK